jgi:hypothetical protein
MKRLATTLVLAALAAGCAASGGRGSGNPFGDDGPPRQIRLIVTNHDFNDATLDAFRDAERIRLGVVTGKTEETFTLPWPTTQTLQLRISLLSAGDCLTDAITVDPGEVIELQIQLQAVRGGRCLAPRGGW